MQPAVALADTPTPSSAVATKGWVSVVERRMKNPLDRADQFKLRFTPTEKNVLLNAKCRFGRNGIHPELMVTYSYDNAQNINRALVSENFAAKGITADQITTDAEVYKVRCQTFVHWVAATLSPATSGRMKEFLVATCDTCLGDTEGEFSLPELMSLHLHALGRFELRLEATLEAIKKVCAGNAANEELHSPKSLITRKKSNFC